ncbi:MAG: hypothetical protein AAF961_06895, partial [Planctomycetota bacterium]
DPRPLDAAKIAKHLVSPLLAVAALPQVVLGADQVVDIRHGRSLDEAAIRPAPAPHSTSAATTLDPELRINEDDPINRQIAALDDQSQLVALLRRRPGGTLAPARVFLQSDQSLPLAAEDLARKENR